jgi:hypothetical protein
MQWFLKVPYDLQSDDRNIKLWHQITIAPTNRLCYSIVRRPKIEAESPMSDTLLQYSADTKPHT